MMQWEFVVALMAGVGAILFPVALVWYLNLGGIYAALQKARRTSAGEVERREKGRVGGGSRAGGLPSAGNGAGRRDVRWNGL
jgi:hypothetical protein